MAMKHSRANYDHLGALWNDAKVRFWRAQVLQSTRPSPNLEPVMHNKRSRFNEKPECPNEE